MQDGRVFVVELNPFNNYDNAGTGGSLFQWRGEDRKILDGDRPFEFRILEKPREELSQMLFPDWVSLIEKAEAYLLLKEQNERNRSTIINPVRTFLSNINESACNIM